MHDSSERPGNRGRSLTSRLAGRPLGAVLIVSAAALLVAAPAIATKSKPPKHDPPAKPAKPTPSAGNLFAVVGTAGNLVAGPAGTTVTVLGTGIREVTFTSDVRRCAFIATTTNAFSQATQAYTASGHLSANGVYVETKNQGGGLTDAPFNLVVACKAHGVQFAVVDYSAKLARATWGTRLKSLGSGRYAVKFSNSVKRCAFLATVGDPANGLVFSPAGVSTATGDGRHTVYVETKNPGGGLQAGVPFHLAVICKRAVDSTPFVVQSDGLPARTGKLASSFRASAGNYVLVEPADVTACATVATRGSVDRAVPFTPATVEITPGPAVNTAGIQVRSLLSLGGAPLDESFHAATVC